MNGWNTIVIVFFGGPAYFQVRLPLVSGNGSILHFVGVNPYTWEKSAPTDDDSTPISVASSVI